MNREYKGENRLEKVKGVFKKMKQTSKEEVWAAIKKMENGKAVGPDDISVEARKCLKYLAVSLLSNMFNEILDGKNIPEE